MIGLAVAAVSFAMSLQGGANFNFVADEIHATGQQAGVLEAVRESCGILALGVLALLAGLAEPLVGTAMLVLMAAGISSYALAPDYAWVLVLSMVWSQGLHVWMPLPNSMTLALAEEGRSGRRLGQIQTAGAIGSALGIALALGLIGLKLPAITIRSLYWVAGAAAVLGAAACLAIPRRIKTPGPRIIFRRRYGLYYLLNFLEGWRKQIFLCFAGFMLVKIYHVDLLHMFILQGVVQALGWMISPHIGRLIDRTGERRVLGLYYVLMVAVFLGYVLGANRYLLCGLYVVDGTFFFFAMALTTYAGKLAPESERTATLSAGVAMNHVAAVATPLVSGLLWQHAGPRAVFVFGTVGAVASLAATRLLPRRAAAVPAPQEAPAAAQAVD